MVDYDQLVFGGMAAVCFFGGERERSEIVGANHGRLLCTAMAKHPFPIPNLISAAAQAGIYNVGTTQPVFIMPSGYALADSSCFCSF